MSCACESGILNQESVASLPQYSYFPLQDAKSIRIFHLIYDNPDSPIRGQLKVVNVEGNPREGDETPSFYALSYTWGTGSDIHAVECDGHSLLVGCNLYSALKRLRSVYGPTHALFPCFIDALCINQSRESVWLQERALQVQIMNRIYGQARLVIVDLGEGIDDLPAVLSLMESLDETGLDRWLEIYAGSQQPKATQALPYSVEVWASLAKIFQRPWFRRIWVVREFALAKESVFLLGKSVISSQLLLKSFNSAWLIFEGKYWSIIKHEEEGELLSIGRDLVRSDDFIFTLGRLSKHIYQPESAQQSLGGALELLEKTKRFQATDKRDRLYGVLGMLEEKSIFEFPIDYGESLQDLSRRFSLFCLEKGEVRTMFHRLACLNSREHPSWMINFDETRTCRGVDMSLDKIRKRYKAGGRTPIAYRLSPDNNLLILKGMVLDRVHKRSKGFSPRPPNPAQPNSASRIDPVSWCSSTRKWLFSLLAQDNDGAKKRLHTQLIYAVTAGGHGAPLHDNISQEDINNLEGILKGDGKSRLPWTTSQTRKTLAKFKNLVVSCSEDQCVGITEKKRVCLIPEAAKEGDALLLLRGFPTPLLARQHTDGHKLLGGAYVCGVMDGEAMGLFNVREEVVFS